MKHSISLKQYIFTIIFGLLVFTATAKKPKVVYYVGVWDGTAVQINNPNVVGKNKYCIERMTINGKKIKIDYKIGGLEFNPADYGFKEGDEVLLTLMTKSDCEPTFHSKGFSLQRD
jgi:hypothetical protein